MMESGFKLSNLPTGWNATPLGFILPLNYGKALPEKKRTSNGNHAVYGSSGMVGNHDEKIAEGPCLIIGRKGSAGKVFFTEKDCWPIDTVYYSDTRNADELKYLYYLLSFIRLDKKDNSTAIPSLSRDIYNGITVPVAPLNEQKRIVDKIDQLFSKLDEGESLLKKVQQQLNIYRQSVLKAAVTGELTKDWRELNKHRIEPGDALLKRILKARREQWNGRGQYKEPVAPNTSNLPDLPDSWIWATLPQLGEFGRGKSKHRPRNDPKLYENGIYPFLQTGVVRNSRGRIKDYDNQYNEFGLKQSKLWPIGTICITIAANIAESGILEIDACFPDSVVGIVPHLDIFGEYIEFFIRTAKSNLDRYAPATAQKNINLEILEQVAVPLPSNEEQKEIVDRTSTIFSQIDRFEMLCNEELTRSTTLRQSILKDAFSGKLVRQDPNDEPASELLKRIQAERSGEQKAPKQKSQSTTSTRRGRPRKNS